MRPLVPSDPSALELPLKLIGYIQALSHGLSWTMFFDGKVEATLQTKPASGARHPPLSPFGPGASAEAQAQAAASFFGWRSTGLVDVDS